MNRFFQKHLIFIVIVVTLLLTASILLKVDSSVRVLGLIEKKEENKVIKTQVSGSIIYNALAPFKCLNGYLNLSPSALSTYRL